MEKVCKRHRETPAIMYGECIGCELEKLRAEVKAAIEREREECARLVETLYLPEWDKYAASMIRARGNKKANNQIFLDTLAK